MGASLLQVAELRTYFHAPEGVVRAVDGVSFDVAQGETLGIVGESGSGKSVACLSIMRLIDPPGRIERGSRITFRGRDLTALSAPEMRGIRGNEISMIFQEPMTSLNPVWTVGEQVAEIVRVHRGVDARGARERALEMLRLVQLPEPERRFRDYPHQLSGGMRQRVMIAMALACEPDLLIADEPTTALDVTIQADILRLLRELQGRLDMAMIFVSHDLGVVAQVARQVMVMYGGQIVERGSAGEVFGKPRHPYTEGLLRSIPRSTRRGQPLDAIPGSVPSAARWPDGCRFHPRCRYAWDRCRAEAPPLLNPDHPNRCWLEEEPGRRTTPES